jgi:hypothetical protein
MDLSFQLPISTLKTEESEFNSEIVGLFTSQEVTDHDFTLEVHESTTSNQSSAKPKSKLSRETPEILVSQQFKCLESSLELREMSNRQG